MWGWHYEGICIFCVLQVKGIFNKVNGKGLQREEHILLTLAHNTKGEIL